ncbi:MAG: glycosyltransferase family 4 protein [Acidobacteriota bacterium]|nr:MAG: glycosyltransferase family 4 protein [Acidobacteriota bacterium]
MAGDRLTVLHINTERSFRGGEVQTVLLARELAKRGHRNTVFAQAHAPLAHRAREEGLSAVELSMRGEWDALAAWHLRTAIRRLRPDVLHAHTPHAGAVALLARFPKKHPAVVLSRRVSFPIRKNFLSAYKYRSVDAVLAVSHAVADELVEQGLDEERIHVAEDGTDFAPFQAMRPRGDVRAELGIPPQAFVVGNVGYFDRNKGQRALIDVFLDLASLHLDRPMVLLLVGGGPLLRACKHSAHRRNLADRVVFTGERRNVADLYGAMDVFFLSTLTMLEGWSGVLTEAMAAGLPAVATRRPVTLERIRDGESGLLVSARHREEWLKAIDALYRDPGLRARLGAEGKKHALQFTPERLADKTEACYRAALDARP